MNCSVYIFGKLSSGYTQYPEDSSSHVLSKLVNKCKAKTQLVIRRDENLMYYSYVRKLENQQYVGLSIVVNGHYIQQIQDLFSIFEKTFEKLVTQGSIVCFSKAGKIVPANKRLKDQEEDIDSITRDLILNFNNYGAYKLPAVDYTVAKNSMKEFSANDDEYEIVGSSFTYGYTCVYKEYDYNTVKIDSYTAILGRVNKENLELRQMNQGLKEQIISLKNKQRNTKWVAILSLMVVVLFVVVYVKVINPNEVTKKDMGQYIYYGPMKDGEPNGIGVAVYYDNDRDGRLYYYGNFTDGKRIDENAILFYKNGSYFKGSMNEDKWEKGLLFDVEGAHFRGSFKDNKPYNGEWYEHTKQQTLENGINKK